MRKQQYKLISNLKIWLNQEWHKETIIDKMERLRNLSRLSNLELHQFTCEGDQQKHWMERIKSIKKFILWTDGFWSVIKVCWSSRYELFPSTYIYMVSQLTCKSIRLTSAKYMVLYWYVLRTCSTYMYIYI